MFGRRRPPDRLLTRHVEGRVPTWGIFWRLLAHKPISTFVGLVALFVLIEAMGIAHGIIQFWLDQHVVANTKTKIVANILDQVDKAERDRSLHPGSFVKLTKDIRLYVFDYQYGCPTRLPTMDELTHKPTWEMIFSALDRDILTRPPMIIGRGREVTPLFVADGSTSEEGGYAWIRLGGVCGIVPFQDWQAASLPMKDPDL
jgi:hypothetical protein